MGTKGEIADRTASVPTGNQYPSADKTVLMVPQRVSKKDVLP